MAVIEEFIKNSRKNEILYVGSKNGPEKEAVLKFVAKMGFKNLEFKGITCGKLRRYFSFENFVDAFRVPVGFFQSLGIIRKFRPEVVFSKGGYVSVPVVLAARVLRVPIVAHESDVVPGLATRIAAKIANKVLLSFEESRKYFKGCSGARGRGGSAGASACVVVGNPIRNEILKGVKDNGLKLCGFHKFKPIVLVMGGSLGAMQVNNMVWDCLPELLKKYQIVHITGKGNLKFGLNKDGYKQFELLFDELKDVYAACDLIVTRGGANALAEVAALEKRVVIVPLGTASSRGDQIINAKVCSEKYGWQVLYGDVNRDQFLLAIEMAMNSEFRKEKASKLGSSAKVIFDLIHNLT